MSIEEFVKHINKQRKANKNKWFFWVGEVAGVEVRVKCYNTWLQIYKVNEVQYGNVGDRTVQQFLADLKQPWSLKNA